MTTESVDRLFFFDGIPAKAIAESNKCLREFILEYVYFSSNACWVKTSVSEKLFCSRSILPYYAYAPAVVIRPHP